VPAVLAWPATLPLGTATQEGGPTTPICWACDRALDVGCGTGRFARTRAARAHHVDAVDVPPAIIAHARAVAPHRPNIAWIQGDALSLELANGTYDVVTAIASLHHMPLEAGLQRFAELARPGGHLAILGHYREAIFSDYTLSAAATLANPDRRAAADSQRPSTARRRSAPGP
jgi:SAM-dependent methyltransferase